MHGPDYYPLPDDVKVTLLCTKISDTVQVEWKSVLPVCEICRADGALPLARTKRRTGEANARRAERDRLTNPVPNNASLNAISPTAAEATDITPPSTTAMSSRGRKRVRKQSNLAATRPRRVARVARV